MRESGHPVLQGRRYGKLDQSDAGQPLLSVYAPIDLYFHGVQDRVAPYTQSVGMTHMVNGWCGEGHARLVLPVRDSSIWGFVPENADAKPM